MRFGLILVSLSAFAQTAIVPGGAGQLANQVGVSDTTLYVTNSSCTLNGYAAPCTSAFVVGYFYGMDNEVVLVNSVTAFNSFQTALGVTRGVQSVRAAHPAVPLLSSALLNTVSSPPRGVFPAASYNFPAVAPGGSIVIGSNTINIAPGIPGLSGTDTGHYLYVSGGTGTAEPCLVTGGTAISGVSGTIVMTCANTHTVAWTISSVLAGVPEAAYSACASGGGTILMTPGAFTSNGTWSVTCSNIKLQGGGGACCGLGTTISRTGNFGDSIVVGSPTAFVNMFQMFDISMTQVLNYVSGNPVTIVNKPTTGAHIRMWGTNTSNIERCRFENMVQDIVLTGVSSATLRDNQFQGLWDVTTSSLQVTTAAVFINQAASGPGSNVPTYVVLDNDVFYGYPTGTGTFPGAGPRQMVQISACEDCHILGGSMGSASVDNIAIAPTNPFPLLNIYITNVKFDSAGTADVEILGDGITTAKNVQIIGCDFNGEASGTQGLYVATSGGASPVNGLIMTGNFAWAYLSTPWNITAGNGFTFSGNDIRYYNTANTYSAAATSSGIYFSGTANHGNISGNNAGGGAGYEPYGSPNFTNYGIVLAAPGGAQNDIHLNNNSCTLVQHAGTC